MQSAKCKIDGQADPVPTKRKRCSNCKAKSLIIYNFENRLLTPLKRCGNITMYRNKFLRKKGRNVMKKKLLVALLTVFTLCLFALTVSAANEVTLVGGTTADLTTVFKVNSSNQVTGFQSDYNKNMVTDVIFPDEIVGLEANNLFNKAENLNTITFAATDTFFISGDSIFSGCSVKTITFDPNCIVELRKGNFSDCKNLTSITFPKFKKITGSAFKNCSEMVPTNELVLVEGLTTIGGHAFNGCTKLGGHVVFPSTIESIKEYVFNNTNIASFDFSKCGNLTQVGPYESTFGNNDTITRLDMSPCVKLKTVNSCVAQGCDNLVEVILPPNLEAIPNKAFAHCYKLQSIVIPASVETVASEAFHSARKDQDVKTFTVYIQGPVAFSTASYSSFHESPAKVEFVLLGDSVTLSDFVAANTGYSVIPNATVVDYKESYSYVVGQTISSHTIVANYCTSLALEGAHAFNNDNPCVVNCAVCKLATAKENPEHALAQSIAYANGFENTGVKVTACTNEGCPHKMEETTKALFTILGYSAPNFGAGGIAVGYSVDFAAVTEYEKIADASVKYGVFAVSQEKLGDQEIFGQNGATAGVLTADVSKHGFDVFEIKVVGFKEDQKSKMLAIGTYVAVTKDGKTTYSYVQHGTPGENEKYVFVSYNSVLATLPKE